jgi:hypothetical protein
MGARQGRYTEIALELLIEQMRTVWSSGKYVSTLPSLDISGVFGTVNPTMLLDILRKKGFPPWIVQWVRAFMIGKHTTLVVQGHETPLFSVTTGVPQGSPLLPILFLFYNAKLLEMSQRPLSAFRFSDDVNLPTYRRTTEGNCAALE